MKSNINMQQKLLCDICANALFNKNIQISKSVNIQDILVEAKQQTIFPIIYTTLKKLTCEKMNLEDEYFSYIAKNIRNNHNHSEIGDLLTANGIKYVFIKGIASASYYKQPILRMMGDVDILVNRSDIQKVSDLLETIGYSTKEDLSKENGHIGFTREINGITAVCEVHFSINGIPKLLSDTFNNYLKNIFEDIKRINVANGKYLVPSDFHHGIILLLHTASHLTNEGIGLRHLCDWAVFVNRFSNDEFVSLFEIPLKEIGMWRFAQLLTLCCQKYLAVNKKEWAGETDDNLLEEILDDVIKSGNFGLKDKDRYRQIKYVSNRETKRVSRKNAIFQVFSTINSKAKSEYSFTKKCILFLPAGWFCVLYNYFILVITRKRKLDGINTINRANQRKSIYSEFKLFEKN